MAPRLTEAKTNVTDDTRRDYLRRAITAKQDAETYHAIYRNVLKMAKKQGLNTGAMVKAMGDKRRDLPDVITDIKDHIRFMACLNMPVTQAELWGDGSPEAAEEDAELPLDTSAGDIAWYANEAGYQAGRAGRKIDECPHTPGSEQDAAWRRGWTRGQEHLILTAMPGSKVAQDAKAKPGGPGKRGLRQAKPADVRAAMAEDDKIH